jgi:hypothetical protein
MRKEFVLPVLVFVGAMYGLWHIVYHNVSVSFLTTWAIGATILALALPPALGFVCYRWGHSHADGMVEGVKTGTGTVHQQATQSAALGLRTRAAASTLMTIEKPEEALPPLPPIQCFGSSDEIRGFLEARQENEQ